MIIFNDSIHTGNKFLRNNRTLLQYINDESNKTQMRNFKTPG